MRLARPCLDCGAECELAPRCARCMHAQHAQEVRHEWLERTTDILLRVAVGLLAVLAFWAWMNSPL